MAARSRRWPLGSRSYISADARTLVGLLLALPAIAGAQFNPRHVTGRGSNSVEASVGLEVLPFRDYAGNRALNTLFGLRHQIDPGLVGVRASVWWIRRPNDALLGVPTLNELHSMLALTGAVDLTIHLTEGTVLEPYAGGGYAADATAANGGPVEQKAVATFGVTLRHKHLLIGQHVVTLVNATDVKHRAFFPLTLGWRF